MINFDRWPHYRFERVVRQTKSDKEAYEKLAMAPATYSFVGYLYGKYGPHKPPANRGEIHPVSVMFWDGHELYYNWMPGSEAVRPEYIVYDRLKEKDDQST